MGDIIVMKKNQTQWHANFETPQQCVEKYYGSHNWMVNAMSCKQII